MLSCYCFVFFPEVQKMDIIHKVYYKANITEAWSLILTWKNPNEKYIIYSLIIMTREKHCFQKMKIYFCSLFLSKILIVDYYDLHLQYIHERDPVTFRTPDFDVCRKWWDFLRSHLPSHKSDITRGPQIEKCVVESTYL